MSGRITPSARVVIMDDVSWSEPVPRGRSGAAELGPPPWMQSEAAASPPAPSARPARGASVDDHRMDAAREEPGFRVADYLDDAGEIWNAELVEAPEVIDVTDAIEDEAIWGPRPRLLPSEPGGRRTVVITGRVAGRHMAPRAAARGAQPVHARHGFQADRTAMWAVLLCVIVLLAAVASH